jgi:hypothetical protein
MFVGRLWIFDTLVPCSKRPVGVAYICVHRVLIGIRRTISGIPDTRDVGTLDTERDDNA